ncbi:DUF1508 domain-containing protein [Ruegeria sp. HKCCE3926]|uniref:YegP family protein n=1 Tax=Ruegeria sp. HKCCE3926 TaxID=2794831 RepID=UPI001AEA8453|nr:DUF1508 domain-containing protein [Ruegeria sp. HKCCE3926]
MYFELYQDRSKDWRWTLKAANHLTIADSSEGYRNKSDALNGIRLVKGSGTAPIYE